LCKRRLVMGFRPPWVAGKTIHEVGVAGETIFQVGMWLVELVFVGHCVACRCKSKKRKATLTEL
jgi:hypothetical protein